MSFDPVNFYVAAGRWFATTADEATLRSVVSRAYYAAFLAARTKAGIVSTRRHTHQDTVTYYTGKSDKIHKRIGARLDAMRLRRNSADYDVDNPCVARTAGEALGYAKKVLDDLDEI